MDEEDPATYEQLADLEREFDDVDTQIIAHQYTLSQPLYTKRSHIITKIPNFWPLVFEQAPEELDAYIQPSDSEILANHLTGFEVTRPDIPLDATANGVTANGKGKAKADLARYGNPRNVTFKFSFSENEWFEDTVLEKAFKQRTAPDGEKILVSEPVRIRWKKGKDPTKGLGEAACVLHDAVVTAGLEAEQKDMKEYKALKEMVEKATEGAQSFFAWYAFRGAWISEDASEVNEAKIGKGEKVGGSKEEEGDETLGLDEEEDMEAEVFPDGEQLATVLAEDVWPNALRYFAQAQEQDGLDMEDLDDMDSIDEDDVDGEEEVMDIKSLVKDSQRKDVEGANAAPPKKKRKT